jgi:phenylalanyl-tRNA synthetase alpha subunit
MEIFAFHPGLKKWIEIGNSGMFRPEMLLPMGLDPNIKVLAWGLSLERYTHTHTHITSTTLSLSLLPTASLVRC